LVDIIVVRSANSVIYDPRVKKIVGSLSKKYSISVLGWNRDGIPQKNIDKYLVKLEMFKLRTSTWEPSLIRILIRLLVFFPAFWSWVFIKLLLNRPKVVHACDLDTIAPCYIYKVLFRKKLVFDVFDRYAITFIPKNFKTLYVIANFIEEVVSEHCDALIVANGEKVLTSFKKPPDQSQIILNCPYDDFSNLLQVPKKNEPFTILFTGHVRKHRGLELLNAFIGFLGDIQLIVTGRKEDNEISNQLLEIPNAKYYGLVDDFELLVLQASCGAMVAFYDPEFFTNNMPLPNKLFEAMMCSVPIITNVAQEIVNETSCGILVEYNKDKIKEAIVMLRDNPELCKRLGNNGRDAFLKKYNWDVMEKKLYKIYEELLK
jgi:glycosyltransferase involved in cell wall biosynthesis